MRISYRLLRKFLSPQIPVENLINDLTMLGHEVESYIDLGILSDTIVVGKILSIKKHPNADKLVVCDVEVGKAKPLHIVCGAKNIKEGNRVPVALVGARLKNGVEIKPSEIRGEKSEGMLCSAAELGWASDHSGILILPEEYQIGEGVDLLIDVSITANRGDCLSLLGIARDIAAKYRKKVYPTITRIHEEIESIDSLVKITIKDKHKCSRYTARLIRGVKIGESPLWIKRALESSGLRSINNVVDATNYVLTELGHPLHPFDYDKIAHNHIIVRSAVEGEEIETLDGKKYSLTSDDLLIADSVKPIALAGIMGCRNSEVSGTTVNVLLESAHFDPVTTRKTSKRLELQTDASYRFERGTDRENLTVALNRATQLIKEIAGGEVAKGIIDMSVTIEPRNQNPLLIKRVNDLLGLSLTSRDIADILVNLGFEITHSDKEKLVVRIPSYRNDVMRDIDLIEEVARIYGYENIPVQSPYIATVVPAEDKIEKVSNIIAKTLVSLGFLEVINYSFTSRQSVVNCGQGCSSLVKLMNPMSQDQGVLRPSLLPSILSNIASNHNRNNYDLKLFEIDKIYLPDERTDTSVREDVFAVAAISGMWEDNWEEKTPCDFYHIKGAAEQILQHLGVAKYTVGANLCVRPTICNQIPERLYTLERSNKMYFHPGKSVRFMVDDVIVAEVGEVHPHIIESFDIKRNVYIFEMNLSSFAEMDISVSKKFEELPIYPEVNRDFAFVLNKNIPCEEVEMAIVEVEKEYIQSVRLFDVYEGEKIPQAKKSLAFSVTFRASDRTLTDVEVNEMQDIIINHLKKKFGAALR